ncbi:uncharacterized protein LOC129615362 isoform X2 [Condylostylus longicornis]|nr:uncharacterized protein LOC129615362 isoform X2 [Condylostylus longicornis]
MKHPPSIFLINNITDYCDKRLNCNGHNHTLCFLSHEVINNYTIYYEYQMEGRIKDIILAHNGIRNRIAGKMNIPNMEHVIWDDELSHMALSWIRYKHSPWILDPCTTFFPKAYGIAPEFHYIVQNIFFFRYKFLPQNFINSVLRTWYLEKNDMPKEALFRVFREKYVKRNLDFHNNFTVIAHPYISRVGCAMAR